MMLEALKSIYLGKEKPLKSFDFNGFLSLGERI